MDEKFREVFFVFCFYLAGSVALSKRFTQYCQRSGLPYYNLTTSMRGLLLSANQGRAEQLCGVSPLKLHQLREDDKQCNQLVTA